MEHQARMCDEVANIVRDVMDSLLVKYDSQTEPVAPDSGAYFIAARPKTTTTLVEKLRRMPRTPLENILDVAGIRIDCDVTLREQTRLSDLFKENLLQAGATKVESSDLRDDPHSGYRAYHLHIYSNAGRAELQVRTPLQAQWANLYEVAADIYGREIRYLELGAKLSTEAQEEVDALHKLSDLVARLERIEDLITNPFSGGKEPQGKGIGAEIRQRKHEIYGILAQTENRFVETRARMMSEGDSE